jgi:hypothetical protein
MSFEIQNAADYIPQKSPFVLVDKLVYVDENTSHANFKIQEGNIFVKSGVFHFRYGRVHGADSGSRNRYRKQNKEFRSYIGRAETGRETGPVNRNQNGNYPAYQYIACFAGSGAVLYNGKMMASCEKKIFVNHRVK